MFALKVKFMNLLLYSDPHVSGQLGTKAASSELRRSGPSLGTRVLQFWHRCIAIEFVVRVGLTPSLNRKGIPIYIKFSPSKIFLLVHMSGCKDLCQLRFYFFLQSPQFPVERYRCQNWITARNATDREYRPEIMDSQAGEGFEEDQAAAVCMSGFCIIWPCSVLGLTTGTHLVLVQASTGIIENAREILNDMVWCRIEM